MKSLHCASDLLPTPSSQILGIILVFALTQLHLHVWRGRENTVTKPGVGGQKCAVTPALICKHLAVQMRVIANSLRIFVTALSKMFTGFLLGEFNSHQYFKED